MKDDAMASQDHSAKLQEILESTDDTAEALEELRDSIEDPEETMNALKWVRQQLNTVSTGKSGDNSSRKLENLISILIAIPLLEALESDSEDEAEPEQAKSDSKKSSDGNEADALVRKQKKLFTSCWRSVLALPLAERLFRRILSHLDRVLSVQFDAVQFCDFLTHAFNRGGHVAALALSGILTLITRHNLDYPDFYKRLYTLLRNEVAKLVELGSEGERSSDHVDCVFDSRHRRRFVKLLGTFLSSAHLPAYLVAAFVKLMVRGALFASEATCTADMLTLAYNVLLGHSECLFLLNATEGESADAQKDPFDWRSNDPVKVHSLETSLWEVRSLERHHDLSVRRVASRFRKSFANRGELPYSEGPSESKRPRRAGVDLNNLDLSVRYNVERDKNVRAFSDSRLFTDCFAV